MVACNQALAVMLTHQLCGDLNPDASSFAIDLKDASIVIVAVVPLAALSAPSSSILLACFLYLLPLWRLAGSLLQREKAAV